VPGDALDAAGTMAVTRTASGARPRWWTAGLAWALWALGMLGVVAIWRLDHLLRQAGRSDLAPLGAGVAAPFLAALSSATVGAILAARRPRHPVGWLLLGLGLSLFASGVAEAYADYGLVARPGELPAGRYVAPYLPAMVVVALALLGFVLLLTPTGSPPSPRWRRWAWAAAAAVAVSLVAATVAPGSLDPLAQFVAGPLDPGVYGGALRAANQLALLVALLALLAGAASLVVRFRNARGVERLQLRWVALAAALTGLAMLAAAVLIAVGRVGLGAWASVVGATFLPLATGAAILRYRLYDLDRIVSRSLAYGLLTLLLGAGYTTVVLGLGRLLPEGSSLAVAAATLAVAALFQPARRRIQQVVDRRFNRRRHDADRVVAAFGARLRDQVDLDGLTTELLAVVDQTMQPTRASLWLRQRPAASQLGRAVPNG
jgi:hypothetical protein